MAALHALPLYANIINATMSGRYGKVGGAGYNPVKCGWPLNPTARPETEIPN